MGRGFNSRNRRHSKEGDLAQLVEQ
jgi:hypothetical protein